MGHAEPTATWSDFLADPSAHAARLDQIGGYEVLTVDGRREYALVSAEVLDRLLEESERRELIASIDAGMRQIDAGEGVELGEVRARLRSEHGF